MVVPTKLWTLWGFDAAAAPQSSFTIGIAPDEETLRARVREASSYPILKVKLGSNRDAENLRIVRKEAPNAILRVDANAAWNPKLAVQMLDTLVQCGVEMLEQPVPRMLSGTSSCDAPVANYGGGDESVLCQTSALAEAVDGVNINWRSAVRCAKRYEDCVARAHGPRSCAAAD